MLKSYRFTGSNPQEHALIVAGLHPSELSGIEVAQWMCVLLDEYTLSGKLPKYSTVIIPEMFPAATEKSRQDPPTPQSPAPKDTKHRWITYRASATEGRRLTTASADGLPSEIFVNANRQFPIPGQPLSSLLKAGGPYYGRYKDRFTQKKWHPDKPGDGTKAGGGDLLVPSLPEILDLLRLIEDIQPVRVASIHGKRANHPRAHPTVDDPGIFVDPRYAYDNISYPHDTNSCKFKKEFDPAFPPQTDPTTNSTIPKDYHRAAQLPVGQTEDDSLAEKIARAADQRRRLRERIPGNHIDSDQIVLHYAQSQTKDQPLDPGFSLGDWVPVSVTLPRDDPGVRGGAPVITVEPYDWWPSWAFAGDMLLLDHHTWQIDADAVARHIPKGQLKGVLRDPTDRDDFLGRAQELYELANVILSEFLQVPDVIYTTDKPSKR